MRQTGSRSGVARLCYSLTHFERRRDEKRGFASALRSSKHCDSMMRGLGLGSVWFGLQCKGRQAARMQAAQHRCPNRAQLSALQTRTKQRARSL